MVPNSVEPYYPTKCPCCDEFTTDVMRRRMNTAYVEEESNYITCCLSCFDGVQDHWNERWAEYYGSLL